MTSEFRSYGVRTQEDGGEKLLQRQQRVHFGCRAIKQHNHHVPIDTLPLPLLLQLVCAALAATQCRRGGFLARKSTI